MNRWFQRQSVRTQVVLLTVAILLPMVAVLAWFAAADLRHVREAAYEKVRILANSHAVELGEFLTRSETVFGRLAARPAVRALEPARCDPLVGEYLRLSPEFDTATVRDARGRVVCAYDPDLAPPPHAPPEPGFAQALRAGRFVVGDAVRDPASGRWTTLLSTPIRDDAGQVVGLLSVPVDLLALGERFLGAAPKSALVSVVDPRRVVLMRSADAASFVGQPPRTPGADPTAGQREGFISATGRDGVARLSAFQTLPAAGWRVVAGLPETEVFADYRATLRETLGVGFGVLLAALAMAWRLSAAIVRPVAALAATAAAVAAGDSRARAALAGPQEIASVAGQFNRMLDARDVSEARLRGIFDSATDAILSADDRQTIVMANPAAARMFRRPLETLAGTPLDALLPARFRARHRTDVQAFGASAVAARRVGPRPDVLGLRADGEEFPIEAAISHLNVDGRPLYTVILRDITERRRAEDALRDSEARQRRLLALLPDAVFVVTAGRISFVNEAAQRLIGASESDLLGRSPLSLLHPDFVDVVRTRIAALTAGEPVAPRVEGRIVRADGTLRTVESTATLVRESDAASILVVLRDVSELRQAQAALAASHADLRRLVAAQDSVQENERRRIAQELHDDLQQTLAAIRIDLGSLAERLATDPAGAAPMIGEIDGLAASAIVSTRRIVNDLRPRILEVRGLVPALQVLTQQFSQRTGIACRLQAQADDAASPPVTTCLYRVAQESLNNVAKHSGARAAQMLLAATPEGHIVLRVSDDGCGLGAADRRKPESFGLLGMQERVHALGGTLRIRSGPGAGTTIEVDLPLTAGGPD